MADFDPFAHPEHLHLTQRSRQLKQLGEIYDGTQYDGRPNWWTGQREGGGADERAPLRERKPCVIYRLPRAAVKQVVRFLFGDRRFPTIGVPVIEPDKAIGGVTLTDEQAGELQEWIAEFCDRAEVRPRIRGMADNGIASGTSVAIVSLVDGNFKIQSPQPEHCYPKFRNDDPAEEVVAMVWCYQYEREVADAEGKPQLKRFYFRRDYDETGCTEYADVEVKPGEKVKWTLAGRVAHGFSFCPIIWTRNDHENASGIDGISLYCESDPQIEALDFTLSQRHRGLAYLGTPQPYETGVETDDGPGAGGRVAHSAIKGYTGNGDEPKTIAGHGRYGGAQGPAARKMSPDEIWTYEGQEVTLGLLETSGKAFEVSSLHAVDIRSRLLEQWGVVLTSMSDTITKSVTTGAEMSAKFLMLAHAPLIGLVGEYRHTWWPYGLQKLVEMALRMVAELDGKGVLVPGSDKVAGIVAPFLAVDVGGGVKRWMPPKLEPHWGSYFTKSQSEIKEEVEATCKAIECDLVSHETGARGVAPDFAVEDIDKELAQIEEERDARKKKEQERAEAESGELHNLAKRLKNDAQNDTGSGPAARGKPNADASGGSGSATAAEEKGSEGR